MKEQHKRFLSYLLDLKAVLFGFTLFNFVWMWMRESQIEWQFTDYHGYFENTHRVFLLLLASFGLLLNRWWGLLVAVVLSGRVIYVLVFRALLSISYAHDVPMFSRFALRNWWWIMYEAQPQYITQIALAAVIFTYSAALLIKWLCCRKSINGI
jgi:hypothetical protein